MNEVYTQECWVIAKDGVATDIRGTTDLAVRQARIVKARFPNSVVTLHYAKNSSSAHHNGKELVVEINAQLSEQTLIATVHG